MSSTLGAVALALATNAFDSVNASGSGGTAAANQVVRSLGLAHHHVAEARM
jgi:hypothetical protein